jgi:hypothetical protein
MSSGKKNFKKRVVAGFTLRQWKEKINESPEKTLGILKLVKSETSNKKQKELIGKLIEYACSKKKRKRRKPVRT